MMWWIQFWGCQKLKKKKACGRGIVKNEEDSAQASFWLVALMDQQTTPWCCEEYVMFLCELNEKQTVFWSHLSE